MRKYCAEEFIQRLKSLSSDPNQQPQKSNGDDVPPIVSSYNEKIRPILDVVENLRHLNITKEGIQLPSIVVVGDQSSGKSSVLRRLIDSIALHLQFSINNLIDRELEKEITACFTSSSFGGIERLLEESPSMAGKGAMLSRSVKVLRESKELVSNIMDNKISRS